jgi:hypothetical protein
MLLGVHIPTNPGNIFIRAITVTVGGCSSHGDKGKRCPDALAVKKGFMN